MVAEVLAFTGACSAARASPRPAPPPPPTGLLRVSPASTFAPGCGSAANGGDFDRATDPRTAFALDGSAYQLALTLTGTTFGAGSQTALLVSRSNNGGATWGATTTLIRDGAGFFNDKGSITADSRDARFVYATWDRLVAAGGGPTMFARSIDNGLS